MSRVGVAIPQIPALLLRRLLPLGVMTVIIIGCVAALYLSVREPVAARLEQAQLAYQAAKQAQDQLRRTRTLQEKAQVAQREVEALWKDLPTQNEFSSFAMAISELGRREEVGIPGMAYHVDKSEGELPVKATLTFKATGSYAALHRFIHRLEITEPYLVIESLDATRLDKSDRASSTLVVLNIKVATFLRPSQPGAQVS